MDYTRILIIVNGIHNSNHVGSVLLATMHKLQARKAEKRTVTLAMPIPATERRSGKLPLRVAMKRRKLVARGSGIYEDKDNGDIWYREGEFLIRQPVDIADIIERYNASCNG